MKKKRATQSEIAKVAGVSQALVSLVFTNADVDIAASTRSRILKIAEELGYRPRKGTRVGCGKVLAYIRPVVTRGRHDQSLYDAYDEFFDRIQNQLVEAAFAAGYNLIVRPYTEAAEITHWLSEWDVNGVVWHARDQKLLEWISTRFPVVQINRHDLVNADAVSANQEELITLAMGHLQAGGHTKIGFIPVSPTTDNLWKLRSRAFENYASEHKLPFCRVFSDGGREPDPLLDLVAKGDREAPTAVIVPDLSALHLIKRAKERGMELPADLSIIGVDNVSAGMHSEPTLTSLDLRTDELTRSAVSLLMARIKNPEAPFQKIAITPELVLRGSVAAPRPASLADFPAGRPEALSSFTTNSSQSFHTNDSL